MGFPLDAKVNYFLLTEFGNNGITAPGDRNVRVTDASITLNHIDGARIRAGLFKTPLTIHRNLIVTEVVWVLNT